MEPQRVLTLKTKSCALGLLWFRRLFKAARMTCSAGQITSVFGRIYLSSEPYPWNPMEAAQTLLYVSQPGVQRHGSVGSFLGCEEQPRLGLCK